MVLTMITWMSRMPLQKMYSQEFHMLEILDLQFLAYLQCVHFLE